MECTRVGAVELLGFAYDLHFIVQRVIASDMLEDAAVMAVCGQGDGFAKPEAVERNVTEPHAGSRAVEGPLGVGSVVDEALRAVHSDTSFEANDSLLDGLNE